MNSELKPKIRFKGFTDDWEQRKFTEFVEFFKGQTYSPNDVRENGTLVLRSSNVQNGEVTRDDNVYISNKVVNVSNVKIGDVIIVVRNGSKALIGKHAKIKEKMPNTVIGAFMTGIRSENSEFINSLLNTSIFEQEIEKNIGATINQITGYMFANMNFKIPIDDEQKTIGRLFDNLDNLITLHQRKCDKLVELKKSLLEKIFPQNNSVIPEIRFKGFTDDWEQRKLNEITDVRDGTHDSPKYIEYGHPFITSKNIKNGFIDYSDIQYISDADFKEINKRSKVDINDILFGMIGTIGNIALIRENPKFAIKNVALVKDIHKINYLYLYQYLQSNNITKQFEENVDGGTQKFIALNKVRELIIDYPQSDEQLKIGDFLEQIDNLITLHQRKCVYVL